MSRATMSTRLAADMLQVSDRRVRQLLAEGKLSGRQTADGWQIDRESVVEYARNRGSRNVPESTRTLLLRLLEEVEELRTDVRSLLAREGGPRVT